MNKNEDSVRQQIVVLYQQYFDCLEKATTFDRSADRDEKSFKKADQLEAKHLRDKAGYLLKEIHKLQENINEWLKPNEYLALNLKTAQMASS
jgi:hypothetical protein